MTALEFWEERYAGKVQVWSGKPNQTLVDLVSGLEPGTALELGCGEGGDTLWLAQHGWQVTAVDISPTAIERGRRAEAASGISTTQINWVAADLTDWTEDRTYDLVTACFLQSPLPLTRTEILRRAARRLNPGGHLVMVSHAAPPPWASGLSGHTHNFVPIADEIAALELGESYRVVVAENRERAASSPDGQPAVLLDAVGLLRRR